MKIKLGTYLAALSRKNLPKSKQGDAAYKLNKLDMLEVTLFSTYTLSARAFCTVILNSTSHNLFFSHCNTVGFNLKRTGLGFIKQLKIKLAPAVAQSSHRYASLVKFSGQKITNNEINLLLQ